MIVFRLFSYFISAVFLTLSLYPQDCTAKQPIFGKSWPEVFETAKHKVVQVFAHGHYYNWHEPYKNGDVFQCRGTGFIATKDGKIYTNYHVINGADAFYISHPDIWKEKFSLKFLGGCPEFDWACLQIEPEDLERLNSLLPSGELETFELGSSDNLVLGQEVLLAGYPLGEEGAVKHGVGIISGQQTTPWWGECLMTTAPSYPGNSGGPVLDNQGRIVGILVGGPTKEIENIGFVIPINKLKTIVDELVDGKILHEPFWGITFTKITPTTFEYLGLPLDAGMVVASVDAASLADQAGLRAGDVINAINGLKIDRFGYTQAPWASYKVFYTDILNRVKNGQPVVFTVYRDQQKMDFSIEKSSKSPLKIKRYYLPFEEPPSYEVFGGMVICQVTYNHFDALVHYMSKLVKGGIHFEGLKFAKTQNRYHDCLFVSHTFAETSVGKNEVFDMLDFIIKEVNGQPVTTVDEFRQAVLAGADSGYLVIETTSGKKVVVKLAEVLKQEPALARKYGYTLSPLCAQLSGK